MQATSKLTEKDPREGRFSRVRRDDRRNYSERRNYRNRFSRNDDDDDRAGWRVAPRRGEDPTLNLLALFKTMRACERKMHSFMEKLFSDAEVEKEMTAFLRMCQGLSDQELFAYKRIYPALRRPTVYELGNM